MVTGNGYELFLINYTNGKLQNQFYNKLFHNKLFQLPFATTKKPVIDNKEIHQKN